LVEIRKKGETIVYSVIFDRELYYKKMNGCFDLNRIDNSIELLKGLGLDD
jgi:hypothetical protein